MSLRMIHPTPRNALSVGWSRFLPPSNANTHQSNVWVCALHFREKNDNDNNNEEEEEEDNDNNDDKEE